MTHDLFAKPKRVRLALARHAYDSGLVRLVDGNLSGFTHLAATRHGLFVVNEHEARLLVHGLFYGVTIAGGAIFAFEAGDMPRLRNRRGRIIRLDREGERVVGAGIVATGLENGCHQLDWFDDRLWLVDTYAQRVLRMRVDGSGLEAFAPLPMAGPAFSQGYAHCNSLLIRDDAILLLLHNGADKTGRASELAVFDRDWRPIERIALPGLGCHNLAGLCDGTLLSCGSFAGEIIGSDGTQVKVGALMTRGLAVGDDGVVVGGSPFAERGVRDLAAGAVYFLDRAYCLRSTVTLPAGPTEIRRIDGRDYGLSAWSSAHRQIESASRTAWTRTVSPAAGAIGAANG